jgi:uncharacterized protein
MAAHLSPEDIESLYISLKRWFAPFRRVFVAFSGGSDSTLVLKAAADSLTAGNVTAVTADSPSLCRSELEEAKNFAGSIGVGQVVLQTEELNQESYTKNDENRCYYCKQTFYDAVSNLLLKHGGPDTAVVDGSNYDDLSDIRPGLRAAEEFKVRHPLAELGIGKTAVRSISRTLGLASADKPEMACLSSRLMPGVRISPEKLAMVEAAEKALTALGFRGARVRYHELMPQNSVGNGDKVQSLARIEVSQAEIAKITPDAVRLAIIAAILDAGFCYATLDLCGYRKGGRPVNTR